MLADLITNATHSTISGFIGVSAIFAYFALIVCVSIYRISQGDHMRH